MAVLSIIASGTTIVGNIHGEGDLEIEGRVEGSVAIDGDLTIGESALIRSHIAARNVVVRGAIAGDVTAAASLILEAGARVVGDLRAPRIGIRPGALLRGQVTTGDLEAAPPPRARAAASAVHTPAARPAARQAPAAPARPVIPARAHVVAASPVTRPAAAPPAARPAVALVPAPTAAPSDAAESANEANESVEEPVKKPALAPAPAAAPRPAAKPAGAPPPVVPTIAKGAKASLKKKSAK